MFFVDSHTHSSCSPDGTVPMSAMARGAVQAGLDCLCLTDHCDFLSLDGTERTPFYNWTPVLEQWEEMRGLYAHQLDLPLGLEFGMGFLDPAAAEQVIAQPELDFIIGSVHNLTENLGGKDFYFLTYETEEDCYNALNNYFDSIERLASSGFYDVLGHIIYPLRYMTGNYEMPISIQRYEDQLRRILILVVDSGRGIEINTWKGQTLREWVPILKLYKQCRGEIITVGSDAHAPEPIGFGVRDAYVMMQDMGFGYVASYEKRKPQMKKL